MRVHLGGPVIAAILLLAAGSVQAGTLTVNTTSDHPPDAACNAADCTLREAIRDAQAGDVIQFAPSVTGTISLSGGQLSIDKNLTITGPGARVLALSGTSSRRIFLIRRNITAAISGLTIRDGTAEPHPDSPITSPVRMGGGIFNDGNLTLVACRITANTAVSGTNFGDVAEGGGIMNYLASTLTMRDCELSFNVARSRDALGGGLYNAGTATLTNCTVSSNQIEVLSAASTTGRGAGIRNVKFCSNGGTNPYNQCGAATLNLINSTITNNFFAAGPAGLQRIGGGIQKSFDAPTNLRNTIVAGNNATDRPDVATEGSTAFNSEGHNLIGITDGSSGWIASDLTGTAANALPAGFATTTPANNGGPTDTHALLSNSQARDTGDDAVLSAPFGLTTDQRGYPRLIGAHVDIGAFEFDPPQPGPSFVVTTTDEHSDGLCGIGDCSLWDAVNASNANTANNSSITFVPALTGTITVTLQNGGINVVRPVSITGPGADLLAISGAGINRIFNVTTTGAFSLSNLTLREARWSSGDGAALRVPNAITTISGCRFLDNATSANWSGGAIFTLGQLTISNSEFGGNKGGSGGAVYPRFGSVVTITGCDFHDNEAISTVGSGLGAAILLWDGPTATVTNCTFRNNKAQTQGGAAYVLQNSTLNVTNSTFSGNTVPLAGRGGAIVNDGTTNLTGVTFFANSTPSGDGGAIYNRGTCNLTNATLSENLTSTDPTAPGTAGGIYNLSGTLTLTNVTLKGNARGGIHRQGGTVTLTNTALSVGPAGANCSGFTGGTACFSDDNSCGFGANRDAVGLLLDPLANYGGNTLTHLPQSTSPLIDNGTGSGAPPTDQRNVQRPQGNGFDVGAVEFAPSDIPPTPTPTPTPAPTPTPTPPAGLVGNVATRLPVGTGDNVLIEGFIVLGPNGSTKKIMVRALGPFLTQFGVTDALGNPTLEIRDGSNALIATNDDWRNTQVGGIITGDQAAEIEASGLAPSNDLESAIIADLAPGSYTAVVRGVNNTVGTGIVDAFDLSPASPARLANVATRGLIQPGDQLMIAGFITQQGDVRAVVRAIGPSLSAFGITNALPDTTLQLRDQNGAIVRENDDWQSDQKTELEATGLQPGNALEAALLATLPPGQYTAQVRGKPETTGIGVVEIYFLQ